MLRGEPLPAGASRPHVVVQPNFQVFAFEPTGEDVLFTLDQLAERVRSEQAIEYELTRDSVYRAQRAGFDSEAILAFLESVSTVGLPQNVRRTIEEWGGQIERITVRPRAPLVQTGDEATLDELYADPELGPLLGRRLAPTAALVAERQPGRARRASPRQRPPAGADRGAGRRPAAGAAAQHRRRRQGGVPAAPPVALRPAPPPPLRRRGEWGAAAEPGESASRGEGEPDRRADHCHLGATPRRTAAPEPAALIRRWAKDWGRGALIETAVLQVEQAETLTDLLADPEVKADLQPVPGAPRLALVRPEAVARLRTLLTARGMTLDDRPLR